jgi:hypothetical protein
LELLSNFDTQGKTKVEDYENLKFIANPLLEKELLENFRDDLYHFFIGYAIKYYKVGLPPLPVEFAVAAEKEQLKNNDFAVWFYKKFEMTGDDKDRLSMDDIMRTSFQGLDRDGMLKEIKGLGIEYKKDLKGFGKKEMMRNGEKIVKDIVGGIVGIKRKDDDDDDEN